MIFLRLILFSVLFLCSFCSNAQENDYVYRDTALLYQDSIAAEEKEQSETEQNDTAESSDYIVDTTLRNNELFIESDSIRELKRLKSLAYAKNLDSLLYVYQQKMKKEEAAASGDLSWWAVVLSSAITQYFFWVLAVFFVCFILYKLFFAEGFFQKSYTRINVTPLPEEAEDMANNADYGKLIALAVTNGNYRLAIRYHYLQSLQRLATKGVIQFSRDKTNYEYVRELSGKQYKDAFASLTLNYEYVWYGAFDIDENRFHLIQDKFNQFNTEVYR